MILDWFNAREAAALGTSLADSFAPDGSAAASRRAGSGKAGPDVQKLLQRAAREAGPLKLNLFKRAKLLESFQSKLLARGVAEGTAGELTHLLLLQLSGGGKGPAPASLAPAAAGSSKRVAALLAEADARYEDGRYAEAADRLREVIARDPRHALAHSNLGATLCHLSRYGEAEQALRRAIELKASCPGAHFTLGSLLRAKGQVRAAETALRRAVKADPRDPRALVELGLTLGMLGQLDDARDCIEKALRLKAREAGALGVLGWLEMLEGRFEAAERHFRAALEVDPGRTMALASLASLRRMTAADQDWLERTELILKGGVPAAEEARLRFALGKYFDDLGQYSRAFEHYKRGNELHKGLAAKYDRQERTQLIDDIIRVYSQERLAEVAEGASDSEKPVFVVGMMRSGTSLVEQIIASHPSAVGAGELEFWTDVTSKHGETLRREPPDAVLARKLADSYLKVLGRHSSEALRVVDKATFNSDFLGPIHRVFPKARILYLRRDPVDTCLSCYFQDFANMASFTLDLSDLAHYYREHHRLVQHWRTVLPQDVFLEVPYAELVADQEGWTRRIIEFLGLPWDPKVLDFQSTRRPVLTASAWQVRQKVYTSSVGRWKHYEKFIGPLLKLRNLSP